MIAFLGGICGGNECVACRDGNRLVGSHAVIINEGDVNIVDPQSFEGDIVIAELSRDSDNIINGGILNTCIDPAHEGRAVFADLGNEGSINCVADIGGDTCAGGINEAVGAGRKCAAVSIEGDGTVGADRMLVVYLNIDGMSIHTDRIISKAAIGIDGDVDECKLTILGLDSLLNEEEVAPAACGIKHGKVKLREPLVAAELLTGGHFILIPHGVSVVSVDEVLSNIAFSDYILNH